MKAVCPQVVQIINQLTPNFLISLIQDKWLLVQMRKVISNCPISQIQYTLTLYSSIEYNEALRQNVICDIVISRDIDGDLPMR